MTDNRTQIKNFTLLKHSCAQATQLFGTVLKDYAVALFGLLIIQVFLDQSVDRLTASFRSGKEQSLANILVIFFLMILSEFVVGNILLLFAAKKILSRRIPFQNSSPERDVKIFEQVLIEEFRAAGKVLSGFLLFIFPGFNRLIHYFFVPFVVLFDQGY